MKRNDVPARTRLSRIANVSAVIGIFLVGTTGLRSLINHHLNTGYQRAITVMAGIEDVDSSVKDMLIASKGLLINPDSQGEWEDSRRASSEFRRSMSIVLRYSDNEEITRRIKGIEADFDDIIRTTGLRFKTLLKQKSPETVAYYYREHYPRVQKLSDGLRAAKALSIEYAAGWFHDKESLGRRIELVNLVVLILSLSLLIYWTRILGNSLSRALESISLAVIESARSIGGVSHKMDHTSQVLEGTSRTQASLVEATVHNIDNVTTAADTNVNEADFGLARSAESWFVSYGVRQNIDQLVSAMQELLAGTARMEDVAELLDELGTLPVFTAASAPEAEAARRRLQLALAQVREIILATRENIELGHSLSSSCVESFENLNATLQQITDSVRSIDVSSKAQRDEIIKIESAINQINDGSAKSAEVSRLVVDEATVLRKETTRLLDSVERLKELSLGKDGPSAAA